MCRQLFAPLGVTFRPHPVELKLESMTREIAAAEDELQRAATLDQDRCCGYFPALSGMSGIRTDLPACRVFAETLPAIANAGVFYRFNFLRLSLVCQSAEPAYHLDSDAPTAVTGDVEDLSEREILRLLLNLSSHEERALHYLDVDPRTTELVVDGSYICVKEPQKLQARARVAVVPPRDGARVHALRFVSNRVLHSGLDGQHGHFVAAYGTETVGRGEPDWRSPNSVRKLSRSSH